MFAPLPNDVACTSILDRLEQQLVKGNKKRLRDIGSLLDREDCRADVIQLLGDYSLFTAEEIQIDEQLTRQAFLDFYYDNQSFIRFSPLLKAYYIQPIEARTVNYKLQKIEKNAAIDAAVQLRKYRQLLQKAIQQKKEKRVVAALDSLSLIRSEETAQVLLKTLPLAFDFAKNRQKIVHKIMAELVYYPSDEVFQAILKKVQEEEVISDSLVRILAFLTNIRLSAAISKQGLIASYQHYFDSLGNIAAMRAFGYDKMFSFRKSFFQFPVDYYGKILSYSDPYPWIQFNALQDIQGQKSPAALAYIAAQIWHYRHQKTPFYTQQFYFSLLQDITHIQVAIEDKNGVLRFQADFENDEIARKNYVIYWASQQDDYEWDELRGRFINKIEAIAQVEVYERWFRRLNSSNDSVAWESYIELTKADPIEVAALAQKYRDLLHAYNTALPSLKNNYLEQLVKLTDFCQRNEYVFTPKKSITQQLEQLKMPLEEKERHRIENQIIEATPMEQLTALEYSALLYANNKAFAFSMGRILDQLYADYWKEIILNENLLRFYLKKATIFSQIEAIGSCKNYLKRLAKLDNNTKTILNSLLATEVDEDVLMAINELVYQKKETPLLKDFLDHPLSIGLNDINQLPSPNALDYKAIFLTLQIEEEPEAIRVLVAYIKKCARKGMVPELMRLLQLDIVTDEVSTILEIIYNCEKDRAFWLKKWEEEGDNFMAWDKEFFDKKRAKWLTDAPLSIHDINAVTTSPFYQESFKSECLEALSKVQPPKDIRRLKYPTPLSPATDLQYFGAIDFSYKILDDIPKFFDTRHQAQLLVRFLNQKAQHFSIEEKGIFYNNLFRSSWFRTYIDSGQLSTNQADSIKMILATYLQNSDLISEFEEQTTVQNISLLDNLGKSLEKKLLASFRLPIDDATKAKIQAGIISKAAYQQIPIVMIYFDQLSPSYRYNFLNRDFGLPIFDLEDAQVHQQLIENHKKLSQKELYRFYLEAFGVDFLNKKGALDYTKIDKILQFDIVTPFAGGGGSNRDYYVYGIIKLLELEWKTRLGFHKKLNENQTFYSFSAKKRATAWRAFLKEKGVVALDNQ